MGNHGLFGAMYNHQGIKTTYTLPVGKCIMMGNSNLRAQWLKQHVS